MDQMTKLVVSDRRKVVTALRIVEREERWAGLWDSQLLIVIDMSLNIIGKKDVPLHRFLPILLGHGNCIAM